MFWSAELPRHTSRTSPDGARAQISKPNTKRICGIVLNSSAWRQLQTVEDGCRLANTHRYTFTSETFETCACLFAGNWVCRALQSPGQPQGHRGHEGFPDSAVHSQPLWVYKLLWAELWPWPSGRASNFRLGLISKPVLMQTDCVRRSGGRKLGSALFHWSGQFNAVCEWMEGVGAVQLGGCWWRTFKAWLKFHDCCFGRWGTEGIECSHRIPFSLFFLPECTQVINDRWWRGEALVCLN